MKRNILTRLFSIALIVFLPVTSFAETVNYPSAEEVLKKVSEKLNRLKTIQFTYKRKLNYFSEEMFHELTAEGYMDFTFSRERIGVKFQFSNNKTLVVYNGSERFDLNKEKSLLYLDNKPTYNSFNSLSFFYDSFLTLKSAIPALLANPGIPKTVTDTTINGSGYYNVKFILKGESLDNLGNFMKISSERDKIYNLIISKNNYLPVQILNSNNLNKDHTVTHFTDIKENPAPPQEGSWYYSSFLGKYDLVSASEKEKVLIKKGSKAPDLNLPSAGSGKDTVNLTDYTDHIILLEFWISHCGYCIEAVPWLNEIDDKYKNKNFKLLAINIYDSYEVINQFITKNKPSYDILLNGEKVADNYGIRSYPSVVVVGKNGKVLYSGSYDKTKIEELIKINL
jgi:thiol-disulfide isomerase/thioredoxin/outer membrane lipoprotein-sorting protein